MSTSQEAPSTSVTPDLETTPGPHLLADGASTRRIMLDVLIGLLPITLAALWYFRGAAVMQIVVCLVVAGATEWGLQRMRGKPNSLGDLSVWITALILAYSLPPRLPLYGTILGTVVAVALGKMAFGGLGHNLFNPAMVGRAFLMVCFPVEMTQWVEPLTVHATTQATPLAAAKFSGQLTELGPLLMGNISGSLGETSALMVLLGGLWLLYRNAADWRLCLGMLLGVSGVAALDQLIRGSGAGLGVLQHLCAGAVLLGAFFIVTDPVSSPLTRRGRWIFGILAGVLTMIIRLFAGYPEGVMFAVLICNAITPLINQWTAPVPVGGKANYA